MTVRYLAVFSVTVCLMATFYAVFSSNASFSIAESETILVLGFLAVLSVIFAVLYSRETIDGETAVDLVTDALYIVVRPENHPHIAFREKVDLRLRAMTFKYEREPSRAQLDINVTTGVGNWQQVLSSLAEMLSKRAVRSDVKKMEEYLDYVIAHEDSAIQEEMQDLDGINQLTAFQVRGFRRDLMMYRKQPKESNRILRILRRLKLKHIIECTVRYRH